MRLICALKTPFTSSIFLIKLLKIIFLQYNFINLQRQSCTQVQRKKILLYRFRVIIDNEGVGHCGKIQGKQIFVQLRFPTV